MPIIKAIKMEVVITILRVFLSSHILIASNTVLSRNRTISTNGKILFLDTHKSIIKRIIKISTKK